MSYPDTPWSFQPGAPVLVLGTDTCDRSAFPFHGPRDSGDLRIRTVHPLLLTMRLRGFLMLGPLRAPPILRRQECRMLCSAYAHGAGILTCFPFVILELPNDLGPTNPQLKNMAEETVPYPVSRILAWICCYLRQDDRFRPLHTTSPPCFSAARSPPYSMSFWLWWDIGNWF